MEWQPISTAPRDGRIILITDGQLFAAAVPHDYREPEELGFDNSKYGLGMPDTRRPNPEAGKVRLLWSAIGCSAFDEGVVTFDGEYNCPLNIEPTHWMPMLAKP